MSADSAAPPVRRAAPGDAAALAGLLGELGYPADADAVTRRLDELLARDDYGVFVAEAAGRVVGFGGVHVFPALHADRPVALIAALVVSEAARGGGHGARLVAALEAFARGHDCERVMVTTANHRAGAHAFYERLGYAFDGRRYAKRELETSA
jgi:GNAT superfamily N-acetyltransferase